MKAQNVLPVILSILVIILVAILEKQSKLFVALTATMPLAAPLALRIVYSSKPFIRPAVNFRFPNYGLAAARMKLAPTIRMGYGVWAIGAITLYFLRNPLKIK